MRVDLNQASADGTGSCPSDEKRNKRLQCIFRIPLPHNGELCPLICGVAAAYWRYFYGEKSEQNNLWTRGCRVYP